MYMAAVFTACAAIAALLSVLMPHVAFRLAGTMVLIYLSLALLSALLGLIRERG